MIYNPFGIGNIKTLLNSNNLYLSKNRGQNYLINQHSAEKIINSLPPLQNNQIYFEVGTGLGALTTLLIKKGKTISLEIDKGIFQLVSNKLQDPNLELIHEDFLKWQDYPKDKDFLFISNLPYSISGEALKVFIEKKEFNLGILMLQKEFADRMNASEKSNNYGALSVISQNFLNIKKLFSVSKNNFFPEPKVDSLVISIEKKKTDLNQKEFSFFIKTCFHAKRKTLANNLLKSPWAKSSILKDPICKLRPDAISPKKWLELFLIQKS